jgi:hypothetical protein
MSDLLRFLKDLISSPGLSSGESPVAQIVAERWRPLVQELTISRLGSLHGLSRGRGRGPRPSLMVAAHMDAIGMMVTGLTEGFLHITGIGSVDARVLREGLETVLILLSPIVPHLFEELWEMLGEKGSLLRHPWPQYDPAFAREEQIEIVVQVNGKIRARLLVAADAGEEDVRQLALNDPKVLSSLDGKKILKAIVVPHKLVNSVVK